MSSLLAAAVVAVSLVVVYVLGYREGRQAASSTIALWLLHRAGRRSSSHDSELLADVAVEVSRNEWRNDQEDEWASG